MAKCLVTGGAGFIGSHLTEALVQQGHEVTVLDNFSTGQRSHLHLLPTINLIEGDIRDRELVLSCCQDQNVIYHLAASSSVWETIQDPTPAHDINVTGTLNVFDGARQHKADRVVFASSAAVYGVEPTQPKVETMKPCPIHPYGLSKLIGEQYAELYSQLFDMNITCFRFFNVFGPRQNPKSQYSGVITSFVHRMMEEAPPIVYGDGYQTRDFVYVADVVQACLLAMQSGKPGFSLYNVSTGSSQSLLGILEALQRYTYKMFDIQYQPERRKDIRHSVGDNSRIKAELGFSPQYSFETGMQAVLNYFYSSQSALGTKA